MSLYSSPVVVSPVVSYRQVKVGNDHKLFVNLALNGNPFDMRWIDRTAFEEGIRPNNRNNELVGRYVLLNYCGIKLEKANQSGIIDPNSRSSESTTWNDISDQLFSAAINTGVSDYKSLTDFYETDYVSKIASYNGFRSVEQYKATLPDTSRYYDYKFAVNFNRYLWNGKVAPDTINDAIDEITQGRNLEMYSVYQDPDMRIITQKVYIDLYLTVSDPSTSWTYRLTVGNPNSPSNQSIRYLNYVHTDTYYEYEENSITDTGVSGGPLYYGMSNAGRNKVSLTVQKSNDFESVNDTIKFRIIKRQTNG